MASNILEQARALHENNEALEAAIVAVLEGKQESRVGELLANIRIDLFAREYQDNIKRIKHLVSPESAIWNSEIAAMTIKSHDDKQKVYNNFMEQFRTLDGRSDLDDTTPISAFKKAVPTEIIGMSLAPIGGTASESLVPTVAEALLIQANDTVTNAFAKNESYGRYIDLTLHFEEWTNLPGIKEGRNTGTVLLIEHQKDRKISEDPFLLTLDYSGYLRHFTSTFTRLSSGCRKTRQYRRYVTNLSRKLISFVKLVNFMSDATQIMGSWAENSNLVENFRQQQNEQCLKKELLPLGHYSSADEMLEKLGAETVLEQLKIAGLKVGGTPKQRAERLYAIKDLQTEEYPRSILANPKKIEKPTASTTESPAPTEENANSELDLEDPVQFGEQLMKDNGLTDSQFLTNWLEFVCLQASDVLGSIIHGSRLRQDRRMTRTLQENLMDQEMEEKEAFEEKGKDSSAQVLEDEEEEIVYNPKNVPLGWDGKPIPYWLYKLHGLNIAHPCEICGGEVYYGRRNFDKHFQESRHAQGMRLLGIPNTKDFHDVTKIEDAKRRM